MDDIHEQRTDAAAAALLRERALAGATRAASYVLRRGVVFGTHATARILPSELGVQWRGSPVVTSRPLLFVGGYASVPELYAMLTTSYRRAGVEQVRIVPLIDYAFCDIRTNAEHLARVADSIDGPFDIVAHSEGGLIARAYLTHLGGAARVRHLVTIGTPHRGLPSTPMDLPRFGSSAAARQLSERVVKHIAPRVFDIGSLAARQMVRGSDFLVELEAAGGTPGPTQYLAIASRHDGVIPFSTASLPDAWNVANVTIDDGWMNGNHLSIASTNQHAFDATMSFLLR